MYVKYNINPINKKTGDCAIRAIAVATGLGLDEAYKGLSEAGFIIKSAMNDVESIQYFLVDILGWKEGKIRITKGSKRPTVESFSREHPNIYAVLSVANHITCCGKGNYVDTWDCGDCSVYKYWYTEINWITI